MLLFVIAACGVDNEETWEEYRDWRNDNNKWLEEQMARVDDNGQPYYTKVVPSYDSKAYVLIHWFNDRSATEGNLNPLVNSVCDVKYRMSNYLGVAVDSSYLRTSPADSIYRADFSSTTSSYVPGFRIALMAMNVGDSCDVIIPYSQGYGSARMDDNILPYSHLHYDALKLVDIYQYEH